MSFVDWDSVFDSGETDYAKKLKVPVSLLPPLTKWGGWYGHRAAAGHVHVAWVGEQLADEKDDHWPPLFWGKTGSFLLRALGDQRHFCYFTNAIKPKWAKDDLYDELYKNVLPDKIVALGRVAERTLKLHGVTSIWMSHPSWVLRFKRRDMEQYAKAYRKMVER